MEVEKKLKSSRLRSGVCFVTRLQYQKADVTTTASSFCTHWESWILNIYVFPFKISHQKPSEGSKTHSTKNLTFPGTRFSDSHSAFKNTGLSWTWLRPLNSPLCRRCTKWLIFIPLRYISFKLHTLITFFSALKIFTMEIDDFSQKASHRTQVIFFL